MGSAHLLCHCAERDHTPCSSRLCYEELPVTLALNNGKANVRPEVCEVEHLVDMQPTNTHTYLGLEFIYIHSAMQSMYVPITRTYYIIYMENVVQCVGILMYLTV